MDKETIFSKYTLIFLCVSLLTFIRCSKDDNKSNILVTDIDGNAYQTVTIGNQVWMKENLKVTRYNNGDSIPILVCFEWIDALPAACYLNDDANNKAEYGLLYNWYAVNDPRKLAPEGWHIPSHIEWQTLVDFVGGEDVAGGKLKEKGYDHWELPNEDATDAVGFTALPAEYRDRSSDLSCSDEEYIGYTAGFWTSDEDDHYDFLAHRRSITYDEINICCTDIGFYKEAGLSVRCIKD